MIFGTEGDPGKEILVVKIAALKPGLSGLSDVFSVTRIQRSSKRVIEEAKKLVEA